MPAKKAALLKGSKTSSGGVAREFLNGTLTALTSTQFPTGITVSPFKDPATGHAVVYVTMYAPAGSTAPTGTIFKTTGGCLATGTWSALAAPSYNGEPLSVLRLLVDNTDSTGNTLLAGTDIGVYRSTDGGATWSDYDMGIVPHVPVTDIEQNPAGVITIATHGAGSYLLPTQIQFAGYANATDSEPPNNCNTSLATASVNAPSGAQNGDVFAMELQAGNPTSNTNITLPAGWSLLPLANQGNSSSIAVPSYCGSTGQYWLATHQYSTNDTTPYQFTMSTTPVPDTCKPGYCVRGELAGFLTSYRGADQNSADYTAYAYPNTNATTASTTDAVNVAGPDELINIFTGLAEQDENARCETFGSPSGLPTLIAETALSPVCSKPPFLDADIWTDTPGGTFGSYSVTVKSESTLGPQPVPAFQVVLPPLE